MSRTAGNRAVVAELHLLAAQRVIDRDQLAALVERYPTGAWDLAALVRWFTLLGAVAMAAGLVMLLPRLVDVQNLVDAGLAAATAGALAGGLHLERRRGLVKTGRVVQLLGSFALQGFVTALAIRFSTGSKNWPALISVCALVTGVLAYALANRLILIHALVNAFIAFGGETGYMSGWGAYWLGMDYPMRFLVAGVVSLGLAWLHARLLRGPHQGFARVYAHHGLLVLNFALWFFAVFGYYDGRDYFRWSGNEAERVAFSVAWAAISGASLVGGARLGLGLARGYGMVFLIINLYTFYFQFVAAYTGSAWFLHLLLVGGSMVAGGLWLERRLRAPA